MISLATSSISGFPLYQRNRSRPQLRAPFSAVPTLRSIFLPAFPFGK